MVYNTVTTENVQSNLRILYTKTFRANLSNKARLEFTKHIESKQQIMFAATTVLINDHLKVVNYYSTSKTVAECKRSMS